MRLASLCALNFAVVCSCLHAAPPMSQLLPDTTKGCLISPDVEVLQEKWNQTELGRWLDDPLMKPFLDDLRTNLRNESNQDRIQYGLTWDDVQDLGRGEAAIALLHTPPNRPVRVVLVDVTGNIPAATAVLQKIFASVWDRKKPANQRAVSFKQDMVQGEKLTVFQLPKNSKDPQRPPETAYFIMQNILGAVEDGAVAKMLMERIGGKAGPSLESIAGYQTVMKRCQADAEKADAGEPQLRWYVNPLPYAEARRQIDNEFLKDGKVDLLRAMRNSGFKGVAAVGGFAHLSTQPFDVLNRAAIFAPPPYERTLAGVKTDNGPPVAPPAWVGAQAASYMGGNIDWPKFMQNIAPLYDYTIGDGDGAWTDTLRGIREDKRGPQVDLEKRLFANMGGKAMRVSEVNKVKDAYSEQRMIMAELVDPKEAQSALEAFYADDPTAKKKEVEGQKYWEIWPEERKEDDIPAGVAVANNHLLYASTANLLKSYFKELSQEKQLAQDAEYQNVLGHIRAESAKRGWEKICLHRFVRSKDAYRPTFEATKANQITTSDTLLGSFINMALGQEPGGKAREQKTDGKLLPDYNQVQHYFLPAGSFGVREDDQDFQGWFFVGFSLAKTNGGVAKRSGE